jgi:hypothetical protein
VNRKLTELQINSAVAELRQQGRTVHWRSLRAVLLEQYGSAGRTDRLRAACRSMQLPRPGNPELEDRLSSSEHHRLEAEQARDLALARAQRSEEREMAHQDRWAAEIHELRETVEQLKVERSRRRSVEEQLLRLQRELQSVYTRLRRYEG